MKQLVIAERYCLIGHILAKTFGLAGLILVVPHADAILHLLPEGSTLFQWSVEKSMAGGGVTDILLGLVAVSIFAYRTVGVRLTLAFMLPAIFISLASELLGTGTGFPFGDYSYLSGLGYKIAGLVPFTIPLSWFYMGFSSYLIANVALNTAKSSWLRQLGAVLLGAMLFTAWDFALEPAMSQTTFPFWYWAEPGAFFGTPYRNYLGWYGTSALFMSVAALLWKNPPLNLNRSQLVVPLIVYLSNVAFAAAISLASGFWIPVAIGLILGVIPVIFLWWMAQPSTENTPVTEATTGVVNNPSVKVALK
ncbi:carotenoid biosynthesis protein [Gloeocapsopsis crepidinum LEGE 06123]|uniref:Carotenoid biosynthesis protein n=2 Tax=Gloeocapsopsis crepidinum TaxID=693223 RepID=A0ABR9UVG6_9CHRO|nr:carotenoid biosynthesis protein [Gloeocapsopsis crepidinum]MBE9192266.1 carotenoid biosynthesis protein [Gloeocapsopsis crepidinum LEGE 06123]